MKKIIFCGFLLLAVACDNNDHPGPDGCPINIACTDVYVAVAVNIKNQHGNPYVLDEYYTTKLATGEKLPIQGNGSDPAGIKSGAYLVFRDTQLRFTSRQGEDFEFTGKKNGAVVVQKTFKIGHDCCHVKLLSGDPDIVVTE